MDSVSAESTSAAASITQNECDLNTPGKVGRSALAWTTNLNIALLLLDKGENQYLGAPHLRTVLTLATSQGLTPLIKKWIEFFSRVQTTTSLEQILSLKSESTIAFEGTIVANQSPQLLASISDLKTLMNMRAKELYYQQREREILGPSQVPGSGRMEIDEPLEASNCLSCSDPSVGARQFGPAGCECYLCPDCAPPFCDMVVNRDGEEQSKCPGCKKPVYSKYLVQQGRTEAEAVKIRNRIVDQQNAQQLGWRFCPTQGCAGGRVVQPQEKSAFYSCLLCGHDGCIKCGKEHHGDCSNYAQQLKEFENLLKLGAEMPPEVRPTDPNHRDYLKGRYRPCYHCGVITERIDGCNHMKCGRCKKDWHWNNGPHSTSDRERNKMKFKPLQAPHF